MMQQTAFVISQEISKGDAVILRIASKAWNCIVTPLKEIVSLLYWKLLFDMEY